MNVEYDHRIVHGNKPIMQKHLHLTQPLLLMHQCLHHQHHPQTPPLFKWFNKWSWMCSLPLVSHVKPVHKKNTWYLDSGASNLMTFAYDNLSNLQKYDETLESILPMVPISAMVMFLTPYLWAMGFLLQHWLQIIVCWFACWKRLLYLIFFILDVLRRIRRRGIWSRRSISVDISSPYKFLHMLQMIQCKLYFAVLLFKISANCGIAD